MNTPESITNLRSQLAERRMVRQRSRRLEEELASYNTPAERLELDAILGRHTSEEIAELEEMLGRPSIWRPSLHL
jgi:chromosome segregation and condensation protein ScpB